MFQEQIGKLFSQIPGKLGIFLFYYIFGISKDRANISESLVFLA